MRSSAAFVRCVVLFASLSAVSARAQDAADPGESPAYGAAVESALEEFEAGRWAEARALFLRAHALFSNGRTLRGIGMASFELGDYVAAIDALEASLAHEVRPLTEEQRAQVTELLERAQAFVGRFVVPAAPDGTRLFVDGEGRDLPEWPSAEAPLVLALGEHELTLRALSGAAVSARVRVVGGEARALDVDVASLESPPLVDGPPAPDPIPAPVEPTDVASSPDPWIVLGVGVSTALVGAALLALGVADIVSVESAAAGTPWPSVSAAYDRGPVLTGVGITLAAGGLVAGTIGLAWGLTASSDATRASLSIGGRF